MNKEQMGVIKTKRVAVVKRLNDLDEVGLDVLAGMWDERTLDQLILALGIGYVKLDDAE